MFAMRETLYEKRKNIVLFQKTLQNHFIVFIKKITYTIKYITNRNVYRCFCLLIIRLLLR